MAAQDDNDAGMSSSSTCTKANLSEKERDAKRRLTSEQRAKEAERKRLSRQRLRETMTPEEREKAAEKRRLSRQRLKETSQQVSEKEAKRRILTPEERKIEVEKRRLRRHRLNDRLTPEERAERLERERLRVRRRRAKVAEDAQLEREKDAIKVKLYRQRFKEKETSEERAARLEKQRLSDKRAKNNFNLIVKRLTMTEEEKEEERKKRFMYYQSVKWRTARGNMSEEERKRQRDIANNWRKNLTGEKKRRHEESAARAAAKSSKKQYQKLKNDPERWKKFIKLQCVKQRKRYATESSEDRLRRRQKDKINGVKRKLRKKLQEENMPADEIENQLREVGERMWKEFYPDGNMPKPKKTGRPKMIAPVVANNEFTTSGIETPSAVLCPSNQEIETHQAADIDKNNSSPGSPIVSPPSSPLIETIQDDFVEDIPVLSPVRPVSPPLAVSKGNTTMSTIEIFTDSEHPRKSNSKEFKTKPVDSTQPISEHCSPPESPFNSPPPSPLVVEAFDDCDVQDNSVVPPVKTNLDCRHCPFKFSSDILLRSHIIYSHPEKRWNCPKCEEVVLSPLELSQHYASVHSIARTDDNTCKFVCIKCPVNFLQKFKTRALLFAHVKQQHSLSYWPCGDCHLLKYSSKALCIHQIVCRLSRKS